MFENFKTFVFEERDIDNLFITLILSRPLIVTIQDFIFKVIQPIINSYLKIDVQKEYKFKNTKLPLNLILLKTITSFVSIILGYKIYKLSLNKK